ncbi:MAG: hypothetical protein CMD69_04545 [Gammaproteobacteria bacterium]|nr:hypothetical protein [Gammaproteobacteria bacterium]
MLNFELIKKAEINSEFYPFFTVQDVFLNKQDHKRVAADFPNLNKGGSFPSSSVSYGESIQSLLDYLEGDQMRNILENKFEIDLKDKPVVSTFRGYSRIKDGRIHSDSKTKIITVLLYLNDKWDESNGLLRMLKDKDNIDNYITEIPASMGSMVAFKVTNDCWHGFIPYEGKRCLIQLNYLYKEALSQHKIRHKLSSFFKKLS